VQAQDVGRSRQLRQPGGEHEAHAARIGQRLPEGHARPPRTALHQHGGEHGGAQGAPAPLAARQQPVDQQAQPTLELHARRRLRQLEALLQPLGGGAGCQR
jgi:hypothetical protein